MVDTECPYYEWLFHDALRSSVGIPACKARPQEWKDANMTRMDYCECDSTDHKACDYYKGKSALESEIKKRLVDEA